MIIPLLLGATMAWIIGRRWGIMYYDSRNKEWIVLKKFFKKHEAISYVENLESALETHTKPYLIIRLFGMPELLENGDNFELVD